MGQPILTFSPDGGQHVYEFRLIWIIYLTGVILGCSALALVKLSEIVMSLVNFVLTASPESLARILFFVALVVACTAFFRWQKGASYGGATRPMPDPDH